MGSFDIEFLAGGAGEETRGLTTSDGVISDKDDVILSTEAYLGRCTPLPAGVRIFQ